MDANEREICTYLKGWPGQFVALAEITRRAGGKRRFRNEPDWAVPVLSRLVEKGLVEADATGHYRLLRKSDEQKPNRWLSPQVKKILQKSGKNFEDLGIQELPDVPEEDAR